MRVMIDFIIITSFPILTPFPWLVADGGVMGIVVRCRVDVAGVAEGVEATTALFPFNHPIPILFPHVA